MSIEDTVKQVVASKTTEYVVDTVIGDDQDRLRDARSDQREAQLRALARSAASTESSDPGGGGSLGSKPQVIDEMMGDEDCPVCQSILAAVAEMDEPRRTRGIAEYGRFREASDISEERTIEVLEGSDILRDALDGVQNVAQAKSR